MGDVRFEQTIPTNWDLLDAIRREVTRSTAHLGEDMSSACSMVSSELVENAIKYGEAVPALPSATLAFHLSELHVRIVVTSGLKSTEAYTALFEHIARIRASDNKMALYVERLEQLLEQPTGSVRLGLYRISVEGGFDLQCRHENHVLTMTATRLIGSHV